MIANKSFENVAMIARNWDSIRKEIKGRI
jgi:hypothetical protein